MATSDFAGMASIGPLGNASVGWIVTQPDSGEKPTRFVSLSVHSLPGR